MGSPKTARNEQDCAPKSHTGSTFFKTSLELFCTWVIIVVYLYCGFSLRREMAPQQTATFRTARFYQFRGTLRMDSVANYESIWTLFSTSVRRPYVLSNALNSPYFVGRWRHNNGKSAVEIFQSVKNRLQTSCQMLRTVTIEIVITSARAALHFPRASATIARSPVCYARSTISGRIASPIMDKFERSFQHLLQK